MSTTTKKDDKEIAKEIAAMETVIGGLSYTQLMELANSKKEKEIETVTNNLKEARSIVASLEQQLVNLGVVAAPVATVKRGRKAKGGATVGNGKPAKAPKKAKGKRGAVGEAITAFVASKGKAGAHVKEIAAATGYEVPNITAFFYSKANKTKFKNLGKATFALKK